MTMPTPEATPLTDAAIHKYWNGGQWSPEFAEYTRSLERRLSRVARVLQQFAECDLNEDNCASLEVATKRIRNIARAELAALEGKHDSND